MNKTKRSRPSGANSSRPTCSTACPSNLGSREENPSTVHTASIDALSIRFKTNSFWHCIWLDEYLAVGCKTRSVTSVRWGIELAVFCRWRAGVKREAAQYAQQSC